MEKKFLNVSDVANLLQVSPITIYSWIKNKTIPFFKINGSLRFDSAVIEKWIESKAVK